MPDFEGRLNPLEEANREIQDSLVVIAHLEAGQSRLLKEQSEYVRATKSDCANLSALMVSGLPVETGFAGNKDVDARIDKLVSAIGAFISKPQ